MTHGSLFSGIGGFDLAAEWMGWENLFHCEWNEFGQKVLNYYWPDAELFTDITKSDFTKYANRIDVLSGGFPCQPYSHAGKRLGKEDERHLWPEMLRAIREIQPTWVVGENVSGLISWNGGLVFHEVQTDLEAEGYEVWPVVLPACAVNAPHRRDRVWFIAYSDGARKRNDIGTNNGTKGEVRRDETGNVFGELCGNGPTPNTDGIRSNRTQEHENGSQSSRNGQQSGNVNNDGKVWGLTTNANSNGHELWGFGQDRSAQGESIGKQEQRQRIWTDNRGIGEQGPTSNPTSEQSERMRPEQREFSEQEQREFGGSSSGMGDRDASYSCNQGLQRGKVNGSTGSIRENGNEQSAGCVPPTWDNFPTQPPVCSRNDGIPNRLDGITFSKWRNESIKAYGNAVVPQVVYQIFKTIESYEQTS